MAATTDMVEAVIISGPRKGEIVCAPEMAFADEYAAMAMELETLSEEELAAFNEALDNAIASVECLSAEMREGAEQMRQRRYFI